MWQIRACVIADEHGLRWRGMGGWKTASWNEVHDYYEKIPTRQQRSTGVSNPTKVSVVRTSNGIVSVTNLWSGADTFREQVERQSVHAPITGWEILGTRTADPWPRVFDYNTLENRWAPRVWLKLFLTFVIYLLIQPALQLSTMVGLIGWAMTLTTAGLYLLLVGSIGLIFLVPLAQYRAAGKRKAERITASPLGVIFEGDTRCVEAAWTEVTGYGITQGKGSLIHYVVETRQGSFDFLTNLKQAALLKEIIRRYAADAADKEWRLRVDPEALGGEEARWSSGQIGIGAQVYHYKTRMYRALLGLPVTFCLVFWLIAGLAWLGSLPGYSVFSGSSAGAVCGLMFLGSWYAYRTCGIHVDQDGLTRITPLGRRRLLWNQVEDYWLTGEYNCGVVVGRGERFRFSPGIVGYEELKGEIARRATECGGKAWKRQPTRSSLDARRCGRRGPESSGQG